VKLESPKDVPNATITSLAMSLLWIFLLKILITSKAHIHFFLETHQSCYQNYKHIWTLPSLRKNSDPSNIKYAAENDHQKRDHYLKYLKPDIIVLGLLLMGSDNKRIDRLCMALELMTK
jgi:hypothetical protein